jgi:hypothetical protein
MLLLFLYPMRKYWRALHFMGKMRGWFEMHVLFGLMMPFLLLMHTKFHPLSLNGKVAFYCMLLVIGSGMIGAFLLRHLSHGKIWRHIFHHWHVVHIPFIYMLVLAVLIHIYSVHVY